MALFAFLYWPTRELGEQELAERGERVRAWSLARLAEGRIQSVAVFGSEVEGVGDIPQRPPGTDVAGVTLVEAPDLAAATALARDFPGRAFGTAVQIRPVKVFARGPAG